MSDPRAEFLREVDLLDRQLRGWSARAWTARIGRRSATGRPIGPVVALTRADVVEALAAHLDELGRAAGVPVPPGTALPRLAPHALADQVLVLATDVVDTAPDVAARAAAAVRETRDALAAYRTPRFPPVSRPADAPLTADDPAADPVTEPPLPR